MKIDKVKCDQCGTEWDSTRKIVQLRTVFKPDIRQIERVNAPTTSPVDLCVLTDYDFCDNTCLLRWLNIHK